MEPITINRKESKLRVAPEWADVCFTCGTCAGGCPVSGVDGMDPRKAVRMAALGLDQELIDSRFPWICTLCGRCEYACPQGVEILKMLRRARTLRERDKVPGPIHKGVVMCLERGNNLGIPKDDFLFGDGGRPVLVFSPFIIAKDEARVFSPKDSTNMRQFADEIVDLEQAITAHIYRFQGLEIPEAIWQHPELVPTEIQNFQVLQGTNTGW